MSTQPTREPICNCIAPTQGVTATHRADCPVHGLAPQPTAQAGEACTSCGHKLNYHFGDDRECGEPGCNCIGKVPAPPQDDIQLCSGCNTMKHLNAKGLCGRCDYWGIPAPPPTQKSADSRPVTADERLSPRHNLSITPTPSSAGETPSPWAGLSSGEWVCLERHGDDDCECGYDKAELKRKLAERGIYKGSPQLPTPALDDILGEVVRFVITDGKQGLTKAQAAERILALQAKAAAPMGVSQWREYGKKYGYWDYFEGQAEAAADARFEAAIGAVKADHSISSTGMDIARQRWFDGGKDE